MRRTDATMRFIVGAWLTMLILNFALWGFGIWVVIKVMQHFGII